MQLPQTARRVASTVFPDGTVRMELLDAPVTPPGDDDVVVRVAAAPIHPADIICLLAGADPAAATFAGTANRPVVIAPLGTTATAAAQARHGTPLAVGLEGTGEVVAAGRNASHLKGRTVGFLTLALGAFAEYCTLPARDCIALTAGASAAERAGLFCNPLTALAIVETLHQTGKSALVHTAAASTLGQMLLRICLEDRIPLVNIVRRPEQADLLRHLGAEHVCVSSSATYRDDLLAALRKTGATVAFDAIGGGTTASELLSAMEVVACERATSFSPYGSSEHKRVYIYGRLDKSPTLIGQGAYGLVWSIDGWAMPPILERAGGARAAALMQRIVDGAKTTFACKYGAETSLTDILDRDTMIDFSRQATGRKYLMRMAPFAAA